MSVVRIATRKSRLAIWQAEHVAALIEQHCDGYAAELLPMSTKGDEVLDRSLAKIGGKGLFVKELERAMFDGEADLAVHSMKDMPAEVPDGLGIVSILEREDPRDAFVCNRADRINQLPAGAVVGTSSLRRQCQLLHLRPDLKVRALRGNVETRLQKMDDGTVDAALLATAGLHRLGLAQRISTSIDTDAMLPAVGQGAIGIECRLDDTKLVEAMQKLNDGQTHSRVSAERAFSAGLGGSCQSPIAGYAVIEDGELRLAGRVGMPDGSLLLEAAQVGSVDDAVAIGQTLADTLLKKGARSILKQLEGQML